MDLFGRTRSIQAQHYNESFDEIQSMQRDFPIEIDLAGLDYPHSDPQEHDDSDSYFEPLFVDETREHDFDSDFEQLFVDETPASTSTVLASLPSLILTEEEDEEEEDKDSNDATYFCAVCMSGIKVVEEAKQLPCGHWYHGECIMPWLDIKNTCPLCRFQLPK